jgi:hypothetical protein
MERSELLVDLKGVVLGDAWISPIDFATSYGELLFQSVSNLNDDLSSHMCN